VLTEPKATKVIQEPQVLQDLLVQLEFKVRKVKLEQLVPKEYKVFKGKPVPKEIQEHKEYRECRAKPVPQVLLVIQEQQERKEYKVFKERLVLLVIQERKEFKVYKGKLEKKETRVIPVRPEPLAQLEHKVYKV
tara:strand:+ start:108 stop:509 length:402 start_codon:yes stop_codon:yes gene_type:complete